MCKRKKCVSLQAKGHESVDSDTANSAEVPNQILLE